MPIILTAATVRFPQLCNGPYSTEAWTWRSIYSSQAFSPWATSTAQYGETHETEIYMEGMK